MRMRWVRARWMERRSCRKRGSVIMRPCTFKHYQNSICTVCNDRLTSIQLSINKCRFYSVPAFDTLILREMNRSTEKSILLPLPSQLIAINVVLAFLGKEEKCGTYLRVKFLAAIQPQLNKRSNAKDRGLII